MRDRIIKAARSFPIARDLTNEQIVRFEDVIANRRRPRPDLLADELGLSVGFTIHILKEVRNWWNVQNTTDTRSARQRQVGRCDSYLRENRVRRGR